MDWLDSMNNALSFMEENLGEEINFDDVASKACCSTYHFQRMFSYITGVSLSEYIRRRRLTLAAFELQNTDIKIIDIALQYGYDSPEALARAFKKLHGVTPTLARDKGITLKAYPQISFQISIKGDIEMQYRIETKEAFNLFGVIGNIQSDSMEGAFVEVPKFCVKCDEDGTVTKMNEILLRSPNSMLHAALYDHTDTGFKYMICYPIPCEVPIPKEFDTLSVPALTWAIFPAEGLQVPDVWRRIYSEWFPTSDFEQVLGPSFEMYYGESDKKPYGEVWIPVKKK
ncbi:AraC family transcriptional regulator [Scatolibacter rhodanostii]|uniref:AraC family transcriptional regulator n=1 Tax=Scatolibacter rhodanostii TaxID=2014781 RepID=UPI000C07877F|nr:AraC family transcriptional regulator [Scatolibacter rhodanostii]